MGKPLIQIDDIGTTREMTDEEHRHYLEITAEKPEGTDETPSAD
jgi:hypothetical protein